MNKFKCNILVVISIKLFMRVYLILIENARSLVNCFTMCNSIETEVWQHPKHFLCGEQYMPQMSSLDTLLWHLD